MDIVTKNNLTLEEQKLINGLSEYLDIQFYYYGSIQRNDYIPGKSDIDVAIFTYNIPSVIFKMQNYLNVDKDEFKRVLWKIKQSKFITYGYKLKYETKGMHIEFAIYNENSKNEIINFQNDTISVPFYVTWILSLIKLFYYQFNIISLPFYNSIKRKIFAIATNNGKEEEFIVLKETKKYS